MNISFADLLAYEAQLAEEASSLKKRNADIITHTFAKRLREDLKENLPLWHAPVVTPRAGPAKAVDIADYGALRKYNANIDRILGRNRTQKEAE